jgi:hypothetical protein
MPGFHMIVAALLAVSGDKPPPHGYYVRDGQPLTRERVRAQDACAAEAYAKVKGKGGRYDPERYTHETLRCITERGLMGDVQATPRIEPANSEDALAGSPAPRTGNVGTGWSIEGYLFDKYTGFDSVGNIRPRTPPTEAEVAAIKRCLPLAASSMPAARAAFIDRCLTDLGHGEIFLILMPPPGR